MIIPFAGFHLRGHGLDRRLVNGVDNDLALGNDPYLLLDTWIIIYSVGQVVLLILIGTLWKLRSDGSWKGLTLINMLITMFLNTVAVCILYYAGEQANSNPPTGLCLAQATLKHGTGPMTEVAILCLGIEAFLSTRATIASRQQSTTASILLIGAPYASFVVWSIPVAVMGVLHPENVGRLLQTYYCTYGNDLFGNISTIFGVLAILATAVMQAWTARILHRSWRATRKIRAAGGIDLSLIVRICIFVALQILFIILTVIDIDLQPAPARLALGRFNNTFEALVPIIAFLIFGLRPSVLEVWFGRWWNPSFPSLPKSRSWVIASSNSRSQFYGSHGRAGSNTSGMGLVESEAGLNNITEDSLNRETKVASLV